MKNETEMRRILEAVIIATGEDARREFLSASGAPDNMSAADSCAHGDMYALFYSASAARAALND